MDRTDQLRVFIKIVETGGFTSAANDLGLPRSTVSTVLKTLEQRLGARLLFRTTRKVSPTRDGLHLYQRGLSVLEDLDELEGLFDTGNLASGHLRVDISSRMARKLFAPALPAFFERYPRIELDFRTSDQPVDLIEDSVDCVVRLGELKDSHLVARRLGSFQRINCASPAYLAAHGAPIQATDLDRHRAVNYISPSTGRPVTWKFSQDGVLQQRELRGSIGVNNAETYVACALAGLGMIQIPWADVRDHLERGELVEIMPDLPPPPLPVAALYSRREHLSPRLRAFLDWAADLVRQSVSQSPARTI